MSALGGKLTLGGLAFSHCFFELCPKLRAVLVSVHLNRVLCCGIDEFILAVRRDCDGAIGFAGELPAVDIFATHVSLPDVGCSYIRSLPFGSYGKSRVCSSVVL